MMVTSLRDHSKYKVQQLMRMHWIAALYRTSTRKNAWHILMLVHTQDNSFSVTTKPNERSS
jgi:hypothetical protein